MYVAGLMCCHDEEKYLEDCIKSFIDVVDGLFILCHNPTEKLISVAKRTPKLEKLLIYYNKVWKPWENYELLLRLLDDIKPDWVFWTDADGEWEPALKKYFKYLINDESKNLWWFGGIQFWNDKNSIRYDDSAAGFFKGVSVPRLYRWMPGLKDIGRGYFIPSYYLGKNNPNRRSGWSNIQFYHYGNMLKEDRIKKFKRYDELRKKYRIHLGDYWVLLDDNPKTITLKEWEELHANRFDQFRKMEEAHTR